MQKKYYSYSMAIPSVVLWAVFFALPTIMGIGLSFVNIRGLDEKVGDIVLMTPNMEIPGMFANPASDLLSRVEIIRSVAQEEKLCLVDVYKIWEMYEAAGYPIKPLLSNGFNHPSVAGHEVYARALMQLIDE